MSSNFNPADNLLNRIEYRMNNSGDALLNPEKLRWVIGDDQAFFDQVRRSAGAQLGQQPVLDELVFAGTGPTDVDLHVAKTRAEKGQLATDRLMVACFGLDTVRSYYGFLNGKPIVPIDPLYDDHEASLILRVGDHVNNALEGYCFAKNDPNGILAEGRQALAEAFGNDRAITKRLALVAGLALSREVPLWASQLQRNTRAQQFWDGSDETRLYQYQTRIRPPEFKNKPNIIDLVSSAKAKHLQVLEKRRHLQEADAAA